MEYPNGPTLQFTGKSSRWNSRSCPIANTASRATSDGYQMGEQIALNRHVVERTAEQWSIRSPPFSELPPKLSG
jgi:hypothetical protein